MFMYIHIHIYIDSYRYRYRYRHRYEYNYRCRCRYRRISIKIYIYIYMYICIDIVLVGILCGPKRRFVLERPEWTAASGRCTAPRPEFVGQGSSWGPQLWVALLWNLHEIKWSSSRNHIMYCTTSKSGFPLRNLCQILVIIVQKPYYSLYVHVMVT